MKVSHATQWDCMPSFCAHKKINLGILPGLMTVLTKRTSFGGVSSY